MNRGRESSHRNKPNYERKWNVKGRGDKRLVQWRQHQRRQRRKRKPRCQRLSNRRSCLHTLVERNKVI